LNKNKTIKHDHFKYVTEEEFLKVVDIISKKLVYKFKFGYHNIEDMKQQITIFALEGLKNYDKKRPLENFLWTHVRNRLFNFKRDNYQRPDKPCLTCPLYDPALRASTSGCTKFADKESCDMYKSWNDRNTNKKNLMYFTGTEEIKDYGNLFADDRDVVYEDTSNKEMLELIEEHLTDEYRIIYLKMKDGSKVSTSDAKKLAEKIREILGANYYE
jgi:DNA-directed RNA polymerase specialized sigma24 family protein